MEKPPKKKSMKKMQKVQHKWKKPFFTNDISCCANPGFMGEKPYQICRIANVTILTSKKMVGKVQGYVFYQNWACTFSIKLTNIEDRM